MSEYEKFRELSMQLSNTSDTFESLQKQIEESTEREAQLTDKLATLTKRSKNSTSFYIGTNDEFYKKMHDIFRTTKKERPKAAILWMDLDHMKSLNDNYGHDVTDAIIEIIERQIISQCKEFNNDFVKTSSNADDSSSSDSSDEDLSSSENLDETDSKQAILTDANDNNGTDLKKRRKIEKMEAKKKKLVESIENESKAQCFPYKPHAKGMSQTAHFFLFCFFCFCFCLTMRKYTS